MQPPKTKPEHYDSDIVIIVTGWVGSGRSTFINSLLPPGKTKMVVGSGSDTCTSQIAFSVIMSGDRPLWPATYRNHRLVLVDTPGFDDEETGNRSVIAKINLWLRASYPDGTPRGGVIYMRDCKTPASDASASRESQILDSLKSAMRGELCFVMTKREELLEKERLQADGWFARRWECLGSPSSQSEIYRVEAEKHIATCLGTDVACEHKVWEPVDYLLGRMNTQVLHDDVVLLVTGLTGSGKSTFVNGLCKEPGRQEMQVSESGSLLPCTTQLDHVILHLKEPTGDDKAYRLVLVDTPGFGNPDKPFKSILEEIVAWFRKYFPAGKCRGGIVYLHDMTLNRFQAGPEVQPLGASLQWGKQSLHVVTTKWGHLNSVDERENVKRAVDACVAQISDDVKVYHCLEGGDSADIVAGILPELETGPGFAFHNKQAHRSRSESSRRRYEASISTLIELITALLRASRGS